MTVLRFALTSLGALAATACAPSDEAGSQRDSSPIGYELAVADSATRAGEAEQQSSRSQVRDIGPQQLSALLEAGEIRLIDVRRDDEVATGMIPGAEHIAMDDFDPAKVTSGDDRKIVLYCRSGRRSRLTGERLAAFTGEPAAHLAGGINAWKEADLPIQQSNEG